MSPPESPSSRIIQAKIGGELSAHLFVAGHGLGGDDVRALDSRPFCGLEAQRLPCRLGSKPKRECSNLYGASVDVDSMKIVFDDQHGRSAAQVGKALEFLPQGAAGHLRLRAAGIFPRFLVNPLQQVEGVKQEVAGTAGRIEHPEIARVFLRPMV